MPLERLRNKLKRNCLNSSRAVDILSTSTHFIVSCKTEKGIFLGLYYQLHISNRNCIHKYMLWIQFKIYTNFCKYVNVRNSLQRIENARKQNEWYL